MVRGILSCFALLSAATAALLGPTTAPAAGACVTETTLVPPKGTRLIYKIDQTANRKCLYLTRISPATKTHRTSKPPSPREGWQLRESEQAALFLGFLRWKEEQSHLNDQANDPARASLPDQEDPASSARPAFNGGRTWVVQLSAQRTEEDAQSALRSAQAKYSVLTGYQALIRKKDQGGRGVFYAAQVGPLARDKANGLCNRIKSTGGNCFIEARSN